MKRKLLFTIVALMCSVGTWAREDVTSTYLTDAALENETANWALTSTGGNHNWDETKKYHESWHNTFTLTQTTAALPAGYYQLSIQAAVEGGNSTTISLQATSGSNSSVAVYPKYSTHSGYSDMAAWWAADANHTGNRNLNRIFTTVYVEEGQTLTATFKQTNNGQWFVYGQMQLHKLTDEEGRNAQIFEAVYNPMTNLDMATGRFKQRFEDYTGATVTGKKLVKTISGLPKGKYNVTLNGGASYTSGRGFEGATGDGLTTFYANNASTNVTVVDRLNIGNEEFTDYTASGALVSDGNLEVGYNNSNIGANWFVGSVKYIELTEPYISYIATEIPAATATALTADKWYKFTPASSEDYAFNATTLGDVIYTTTDQLPSTATGDAVSATMTLTAGTTYYIKSSSAQELTIAPFTYIVGSAAADFSYIQEGNTVTVSYASLTTDNPNASLVKDFSGVTFGGNSISCTATANGFTFTVPTVTAGTEYSLSIPAGAIGYSNGDGTYNAEQVITLHAPTVFNGTYYLYNPYTQRFLGRGAAYGTSAVVDKYGIPFTLTVQEDGSAKMVFLDNNQGFFGDTWCYADNAAQAYLFETATEGSYSGYTLKRTNVSENNKVYAYTKEDGDKYRVAANAMIDGDNANITDWAQTIWQLKTPAERNAILDAYPSDNKQHIITAAELSTTTADFETYLTTNYAGKDYTDHVGTAKITNAAGSWTWNGVKSQDGQPAYNNAAEAWCATGSWTQTITDLPEGIYRIKINAFERRANNATSYQLGEDGYGNVTSSYLKANDEQVRLKSWYEEVVKNGDNYNPNTMAEAVTAFNNDKYKSEVYTYVGNDGNLTITIAKPNYIYDCWLLWNNVTLTYFSDAVAPADVTALLATAAEYLEKPMLATLKTAISVAKSALEADGTIANYNALQDAIDNSQTSVDSYASMKANYLDPMEALLNSTNVYQASLKTNLYDNYLTRYNEGSISNADANALNAYAGGKGTRPVDNLLMPSWTNGGQATGDKFYQNTWSNEGVTDGTNFLLPFYEYWVDDANVLQATTLQATQAGLSANTMYKVTAWVRVRESNAGDKIANGVTLQVGEGSAVDVSAGEKVGDSKLYIAEFAAVGQADAQGNLTIKFTVADGSNISWLAFKNLNYEVATEATANMKVKANKWGTFIAPFDVTIPNGIEAYTISNINEGKLELAAVETTIEANTPVILKNTTSTEYTNNFTGYSSATAESYTANYLTGVYTATTIAPSTDSEVRYVLQTQNDTQAFYKVTSAFTATANRCYLTIPATTGNGVKAFFLDFGGEDAINGIEAETENAEIFNLAGQRVNKAQRGIYIINGKKVLVK